jgi:hypothetical protein
MMSPFIIILLMARGFLLNRDISYSVTIVQVAGSCEQDNKQRLLSSEI